MPVVKRAAPGAVPVDGVTGSRRRQPRAVFENAFLHISVLPLGSGCATWLGTKPGCSPNFATCSHQLENAKSIKHGLPQNAGSVRSVQVLVYAEREPGKRECRRLLHFFSQEQEGIITSDWISSHDVCNTIC